MGIAALSFGGSSLTPRGRYLPGAEQLSFVHSDKDHFGLDDLVTMKMPNPLGEPGHPEYYKTETAFMANSRRINFLTRNLVHALVHLLVDMFQF